ncbi:MAG: hypothetical protein P1U85_22770 [Verrucomicrobiales bacterium]|nr:hypothetical protein [Verrucomicrobiales bacterium]
MKKIISTILALCLAASVFGGPQPGAPTYWFVRFNLQLQAWHATEILIVNEGEEIDGKVTVEEVLHGSKAVGDTLEFPGLAKLADPKERILSVGGNPASHGLPRLVDPEERTTNVPSPDAVPSTDLALPINPTEGLKPEVIPGHRMILFLGGGGKEIVVNYASGTMRKPPKPENFNEHPITRNVALIDGDRLFAKSGRLDTPPIPFVDLDMAVGDLREIVATIQKGREGMKRCEAMEDAETRAAEAVHLIDSSNYRVQLKGFEILFGCGADAIPHIQAYLEKHGFDSWIATILEQIRATGWKEEPELRPGENFVPPLIYLADREIEFWRRTLSALEVDWWKQPGLENQQRHWKLQERAQLTAKVVRALGAVGTPEALAEVAEMRDFSKSQTWLKHDMGGRGGGLYWACLAALGELTAEKRRELHLEDPGYGR